MNLYQRISSALLSLYKNLNRTGILDNKWTQSLFISSYFAYKKYLEDANAKLTKKYPKIFQNGHILDIGANIGYTSYVFSKAVVSPYRVFAFEPEKRNLNILKQASKTYHFADNLVLTAAAVGDKEGEIEIWQNDAHHADHRVLTNELRKQLNSDIKIQKTALITIDNFLKANKNTQPIAFVKIDVQGYELPVCRGMEATLDSNPNCVVGFEYCPSIIESLGYNAKELIQFFQDKNYFFYRLNKNGTVDSLDLTVIENLELQKDFSEYIDILCSKRILTDLQ